MKPVRVLLIDDHPMVRQGLRTFLDLNESIEVVGEAENGKAGVEQVKALQPDVVLMDIVMPVMDGVEATREIQQLPSPPKVLILTSFLEDDKVFPALEAGAHGYMLKDISPDELVLAIQNAHQGEPHLHPSITKKLMTHVMTQKTAPAPTESKQKSDSLTQRETEVLGLIAEGLNNKAIAMHLNISQKTVKTHVSHILAKLDLEDRTQAAIFAIKNR